MQPARFSDAVAIGENGARADGLTSDEGRVMDSLTDAVAWWDELTVQHPNETHEFYSAIHRAQDLLAVRIARRHYPGTWVTHDA